MDSSDRQKMYAWRRKWLPNEPDTDQNFAYAIWLEKNHWENMQTVTASGVAKAFGG